MRIAVFAGSSRQTKAYFLNRAQRLGETLAERNHLLVYGGGRTGSMGALAEGALSRGGDVRGVILQRFVDDDVHHPDIPLLLVDDMRSRKAGLDDGADAFIALPGGLGTFEEFTEILSLRKLKFHERPLVLLDRAFFAPWLTLFQNAVDAGFEKPAHASFFALADSAEEAVSICEGQVSSP